MKKLGVILSLAALAVSSGVQAADICCYPDCDYAVQYPYVGAMISGVRLNTTLEALFPSDSTPPLLNDSTDLPRSNQLTGGIALGYASRWSGRWYFAGEASSQPISVTNSKTWTGASGVNLDSTLKVINYFNADAIPGYYLCQNFLFYLRFGVAISGIQLDQDNFFGTNFTDRYTVTGFRAGAGLDYSFTRRLSTGIDYIYTTYGTRKFADNIPVTGGFSRATFSAKLQTSLIGIHLNYKILC